MSHGFCSLLLSNSRDETKKQGIRVGKLSVTGDPKCYYIQEQQPDGSWADPMEITKADCVTGAKAEFIMTKLPMDVGEPEI